MGYVPPATAVLQKARSDNIAGRNRNGGLDKIIGSYTRNSSYLTNLMGLLQIANGHERVNALRLGSTAGIHFLFRTLLHFPILS
jgi:hypothetical protein